MQFISDFCVLWVVYGSFVFLNDRSVAAPLRPHAVLHLRSANYTIAGDLPQIISSWLFTLEYLRTVSSYNGKAGRKKWGTVKKNLRRRHRRTGKQRGTVFEEDCFVPCLP